MKIKANLKEFLNQPQNKEFFLELLEDERKEMEKAVTTILNFDINDYFYDVNFKEYFSFGTGIALRTSEETFQRINLTFLKYKDLKNNIILTKPVKDNIRGWSTEESLTENLVFITAEIEDDDCYQISGAIVYIPKPTKLNYFLEMIYGSDYSINWVDEEDLEDCVGYYSEEEIKAMRIRAKILNFLLENDYVEYDALEDCYTYSDEFSKFRSIVGVYGHYDREELLENDFTEYEADIIRALS